MSEIWLPVRGYETFYEVSDAGRVRRAKGGRGAIAGRILCQADSDGYRHVQLSRQDRKRKIGVHILVCEAFHWPRPRGKRPNHKNLNRADNRAVNLDWLTRKQNAQHGLENGRRGGKSSPGQINGRAKLTSTQVATIREQKGKVGQRVLAALCAVSKTAIQLIHQGRNWPEDLRVRQFPLTGDGTHLQHGLLSPESKSEEVTPS